MPLGREPFQQPACYRLPTLDAASVAGMRAPVEEAAIRELHDRIQGRGDEPGEEDVEDGDGAPSAGERAEPERLPASTYY
jgi:hypothetical protein